MRIQQQSTDKKWYILTAVVITLTIALLIGYFAWYIPYQDSQNLPEPEINVTNNTTENTSVTEIDSSVQTSNPNNDSRDPAKSPEQYEGQNASGDTSNANCIDPECSNFALPEEEL